MTELSHEYVPGELIYYTQFLSPELKKLYLLPISDAHRGSPLFSQKHFEQTVAQIASKPDYYTILNGDLCESDLRTSKGEIFKQVGTPQDQRDWMIEKLYPIRHKILGMTTGNHEARIYNETGIDISKDIAQALGIPYRAEGLILKITFGSGRNRMKDKPYTYFLYMTHGYGGARTAAAKAVKLERVANYIHADAYLMCLSQDTEILTNTGWKTQEQISIGESALTLNRLSNLLEYQPIENIYQSQFDGDLIQLHQKGTDVLATPNHRIIYRYKEGTWLEKELQDFILLSGQVGIPQCGEYRAPGVPFSDDYLRLMAWIITEGHFRKDSSSIAIRQSSSSSHIKEIEDLLKKLDVSFGRYESKTKGKSFSAYGKVYQYNGDAVTFHIHAKDGLKIRQYLNEKRIPNILQEMDEKQFRIFFSELLKGDGNISYSGTQYITKDLILAGQLQALCFKHNMKVTISKYKRAYTLCCSKGNRTGLIPDKVSSLKEYHGLVWCVTVPNGTFVARRNGRAFVTGNSHDHMANAEPVVYLVPEPKTHIDAKTGFRMGRVRAVRKLLIKTNAYVKFGGYSESGGFAPTDLFTPIVQFNGEGAPEVHVLI